MDKAIVKFLIIAGVMAKGRWPIREASMQVLFCDRPFLIVPVVNKTIPSSFTDWEQCKKSFFEQEEIILEKFSDAQGRYLYMGYGPKTNVLAIGMPEEACAWT
jgi:hypothetical protein